MRPAPAVDCPLADGRAERVLIVLLHALAFGVAGGWAEAWRVPDAGRSGLLPSLAGALSGVAIGVLSARACLPPTAAPLRWTGQGWQLGEQVLDRVDLQIDLGSWLLLRLHGVSPPGGTWVVARRRGAGAAWHALRVALQAHGGRRRDDGDAPSAARPGA